MFWYVSTAVMHAVRHWNMYKCTMTTKHHLGRSSLCLVHYISPRRNINEHIKDFPGSVLEQCMIISLQQLMLLLLCL